MPTTRPPAPDNSLPPSEWDVDESTQASWVAQAGTSEERGVLLLWRRDGQPPGPGARPVTLAPGAQRQVQAVSLPVKAALGLLQQEPQRASPSLRGWSALARLARELVRRGSVRPAFDVQARAPAAPPDAPGRPEAFWCARLDADERAVLGAILAGMPPASFAAPAGLPASEPSACARAFLDSAVDALVRTGAADERRRGSFEAAVEAALGGPSRAIDRACAGFSERRALERWEDAARVRETPRMRLVLSLEATEAGDRFRLSYAAETKEGTRILGPASAADIWCGAPEALLLADDLPRLRQLLRDALQKAGRLLAPVEVSLASPAPTFAVLDRAETWNLLTRQKPALESAGVRVAVPPELAGIEARFPRPRVRLEALPDGVAAGAGAPSQPAPDESAALARTYAVRWEVVVGDEPVAAQELRSLGAAEPLACRNGTWIPITAEAAERLARIAEREEAEWSGARALAAALVGEVRLPGDLSDAAVVPDAGLARLLDELSREAAPVSVPAGLRATLRAYQLRGLAWMAHRTRLGLGALLADDMGLGKTVQVIALLLRLRELRAPGGPTLVVCPASVVGNWERELARFAPELKVVRHHGAGRARAAAEVLAAAGPHDVVVTTWSLVRLDAELLASVPWGTLVCDEAQSMKNASAATSRAARSLPARRRVALSGTPVENRLSELWSLLEFANPGLLGPLEKFRREIANPIERDRDARATRWLKAATAPFLLRRLKRDPDIAPELPEKEIIRVVCALTAEQARLYEEAVQQSLSAIDSAEGMERRGRVLKLLTALKQICNHPAHFLREDGPLAGRSGKLERTAEMLEEIADSGERALIFTQYTEMGERLCAHLSRRLGRPVPFFHGGLTLPQREEMVREFQESADGPPALVLSLRAGGTGLNLTRATHVIHYDRWWNPAVEDQATDRAYRIGQESRVQVHLLLSMGTLEERIDRMLEEKRALAASVTGTGEAWLTELSTDELRALVSLAGDVAVESFEAE